MCTKLDVVLGQELAKLCGFERQFWEIKRNHMDVVLFIRCWHSCNPVLMILTVTCTMWCFDACSDELTFTLVMWAGRIGDRRRGNFYNLFDIDADVGLDDRVGLKLSGKHRVNMWQVGCPVATINKWMVKVGQLGHTVGRVEQVVDAAGQVVGRAVKQIMSPATIHLMPDWVPTPAARHILALAECQDGELGVCFMDVSMGQVYLGELEDDGIRSKLVGAM
ncbi:hypothetical protein CYMTET_6911 [Cymbomonas tetramitiformis]|uniref:DNA mismatch repair protein MutS-like N-terminal domain-containing protein n=1 Tax=Cymbomonas tetramitiformis TaxID=36881 RepID=A0AAE0GWJ0_9CHLO|nr:hypothetical protein CYMTET_6911 [Cymbomonas tetramitiformis]